jgi:hypothetical protein
MGQPRAPALFMTFRLMLTTVRLDMTGVGSLDCGRWQWIMEDSMTTIHEARSSRSFCWCCSAVQLLQNTSSMHHCSELGPSYTDQDTFVGKKRKILPANIFLSLSFCPSYRTWACRTPIIVHSSRLTDQNEVIPAGHVFITSCFIIIYLSLPTPTLRIAPPARFEYLHGAGGSRWVN